MEKIKVDKQKLLSILAENKSKHINDYNVAVEGYKIAVKKALSKKMKELKALKNGELQKFNMNFYNLIVPESHEKDFDTVIGMLNVSTDMEIYITSTEYQQYYLNEWSWKNNWYVSNSTNINIGTSNPASMYYVDAEIKK
jgi:hypothetical protein